MLLTDYLAQFLILHGVTTTFGLTGSAIAPVFDSFNSNPKIKMICVQNEQAAAMAADAYARVSGNFGVAISTSGPGGTNMLTGIACSWFDHIPALYITGQVNSRFTKGDLPIKQAGFQETGIVCIASSITKYAVMIKDPKMIRYELEKAVYIAKSGRPGPVLIDLPMDMQTAKIDEKNLKGFTPNEEIPSDTITQQKTKILSFIKDLSTSKRPVILVGGGVSHADAVEELHNLLRVCKVPVVLTWPATDNLDERDPLYRGRIGTYGQRGANFTIQNADLLLSLGSRHDGRQTGGRLDSFAREAKRYVVDVEKNELKYQQIKCHVNINADLKKFLPLLTKELSKVKKFPDFSGWLEKTLEWKNKYSVLDSKKLKNRKKINGYVFMDELSDEMKSGDVLVGDTGGNIVQLAQAFKVKKGQRIISAWAHTPMGYALAASMGAYYGRQKKHRSVICTIGDGGMQVNIQELQTLKTYNIPVKIFIMNNESYGIIKQFQDTYFESRYVDSHHHGYETPDYVKIGQAYGINSVLITNPNDLREAIKRALRTKGPVVYDIRMDTDAVLEPRLGWDTGIEDQMPYLPRKEFYGNLFIKPLDGKDKTDKNLPSNL